MDLHQIPLEFEKEMKGLVGGEAMRVAETWAEKHPDRVHLARVDDSHFAGSYLAFVTHEEEGKTWMGISVYVIPQVTGEAPVQFFLYPGHVSSLLPLLSRLHQKSLTYPEVKEELEELGR